MLILACRGSILNNTIQILIFVVICCSISRSKSQLFCWSGFLENKEKTILDPQNQDRRVVLRVPGWVCAGVDGFIVKFISHSGQQFEKKNLEIYYRIKFGKLKVYLQYLCCVQTWIGIGGEGGYWECETWISLLVLTRILIIDFDNFNPFPII